MKFIARKGAPNIPLELIEAQESEKLIFFCGAGISYAAGLPGFSGLVDNVYANLGENKTDTESEAIGAGFFDRALGLLEARISGAGNPEVNHVRRAIIEELAIGSDANLTNHEVILNLSKTANKKCRLVTTNVDHGFLNADPALSDIIDSAPKLPVPKPHKWTSIVHLHGIIDDNYPNGENLVFTSGDFGTAYLTERWASKFVTELFSHFTVLFVGYSVNDPVIRYMTDAIAAERLRGYKVFQKPYVIAHTKPSERSVNENIWKAKGIDPILYQYSHSNLYNTLKEWWNYKKDGLNAKARIVSKEAVVAPLPPYDKAPEIMQLIDVLSEKTMPGDGNVTGYPAEVFSNINNPPAPIEWLPVLDEKGLLAISNQNDDVFPVHWSALEANLRQPNKISFHLWNWFLKHLESDNLIKWIIDKGVCLHPELKQIIDRHIKNNPPKDPYLLFWKIVTSSYVTCVRRLDSEGYGTIRALRRSIDQLTLGEFSKLLEPTFKIDKSIDLSDVYEDEDEGSVERVPFKLEVVIGISDWTFGELIKHESYPSGFSSLLLTTTHFLKKAIELWELAGFSGKWDDRSHWDIKSISPHSQNNRFHNWVILIELCRDLWEATWEDDRENSIHVMEIWRSINFPVFRRLVLHALTVKDIYNGPDAIRYLLEDNGWWLWSTVSYREVYRFLNKYWPILDDETATALIEAILQGPPRGMFHDDISDEEFKGIAQREIWLKLAKLEQFGGRLPSVAIDKFSALSQAYPRWTLREGDRDEFTSWLEVGSGHQVDITIDDLFNKNIPEIIEFLSDSNQWYKDGRINLFREGCKTYRLKGFEVLCYLSNENNWNNEIWHAGLVGLSGSENNAWNFLAPLLVNAGLNLYREEPWSIAHWVKETASSITCGSTEEDYFWTIFNLLLTKCEVFKEPDNINEAVNYAINNPIGIITEALMERFSACKLKASGGIPDGPLKDSCVELIQSNNPASLAGVIILSSRLNYFHAVDPKWTEENLIPLFSWETSEYCALIWQGYLWSPRISPDLAVSLKTELLLGLENIEQIGDSGERLIKLFTIVCLQYQDLYKGQEQRDAFVDIGVDGLAHVAEFFYHTLRQDPNSADNYWLNRIKPVIKRAWPKSAEFVTTATARYFTLMVMELDNEFEEALKFISPYLRPLTDQSLVFSNLNSKELPDTKPEQVFLLIEKIFSEGAQWPSDNFRKVMNRIGEANPDLLGEATFRRIDDYLMRHNQ